MIKKEILKQYKKKIKLINKYNKYYHDQNKPKVTDSEFDELKKEILLLESSYNFLKSKYGNWIVYEPEINKFTFLLWLLPIFLFIFGGLLIVRNLFINRT